jgi:hypothetical protein
MATDIKTEPTSSEPQTSVTTLVSGIVHDAQELAKQQFELFKQEVRADIRNLTVGVQVLSIAGAFALTGLVMLGVAIALALTLTGLDPWACYLIVAGGSFVIAGIFLGIGVAKLREVHTLPEQSAEALKENLQWKMTPK